MDVLRAIILRGNIRNAEEKMPPNPASGALELILNNRLTKSEPVKFSIDFYEKGFRIQYDLAMDLGLFLDEDYPRKITFEKLTVNDEMVYSRNGELECII